MGKSKWTTVSLPRDLIDDINKLIDKRGYWPSMSSFVREAALEKLRREIARDIIPVLGFEPMEKRE